MRRHHLLKRIYPLSSPIGIDSTSRRLIFLDIIEISDVTGRVHDRAKTNSCPARAVVLSVVTEANEPVLRLDHRQCVRGERLKLCPTRVFEWRGIVGKTWTYIFDSSVKETTFVDMRTFDRILSMKKKRRREEINIFASIVRRCILFLKRRKMRWLNSRWNTNRGERRGEVALCKILLLIKNRLEIVFLVMKISQLPLLPPSLLPPLSPFEIPHFEEQRINLSR